MSTTTMNQPVPMLADYFNGNGNPNAHQVFTTVGWQPLGWDRPITVEYLHTLKADGVLKICAIGKNKHGRTVTPDFSVDELLNSVTA